MNAPRSTGRRSHDPEDRRPQREPERQSERRGQKPLTGSDASPGASASPEQRCVPSTPGELVAMQRLLAERQPAPEPAGEARVAQAMELLLELELNAWESQQIALALVQQLESYHQGVVAEMHEGPRSPSAQVACWAIDGDRLMHCRRLLESITLI